MAAAEPENPPATASEPSAAPAAPATPAGEAAAPAGPAVAGSGAAAAGVSLSTQELRIATTMTGGVSLAIWMGGVARELNLLDQASRDRVAGQGPPTVPPKDPDTRVRTLYRRLLDMMDMTVSIDVLSGTSAGGINAAVLGMAHAGGLDIGLLREIWLTAGAFGTLLRDPAKADRPPSLLQGDDVLLAQLSKGLDRLAAAAYPAGEGTSDRPSQPDTTVFITTTLLTGETSRFTDTYGTLVPDVDHHGLFTFTQADLTSAGCRPAIALAARSSASFPAAFEPSFVPFGTDSADPQHPDMARFIPVTRSHFAADGGLLANRPIRPLLQAVFDRPIEQVGQVRRVLLYVVPSPGDPDPSSEPPNEQLAGAPTLPRALLDDLGAVLNQSIASDLDAIRQHNDRVEALRDSRLRLAELGLQLRAAGTSARIASAGMVEDYRARESERVARRIVEELMREVSSVPAAAIPAGWLPSLRPGTDIEARCRQHVAAAVQHLWSPAAQQGTVSAEARFGRAGFDAARSTALRILQLGLDLATTDQERTALAKVATHLFRTSLAHRPANLTTVMRRTVAEAMASSDPPDLPAVAAEALATLAAEDVTMSVEGAWRVLTAELWDAGPQLWALVSGTQTPRPADATATGAATGAATGTATGAPPPGIGTVPVVAAEAPARSTPGLTRPVATQPSTEARRVAAAARLTTYLNYLELPMERAATGESPAQGDEPTEGRADGTNAAGDDPAEPAGGTTPGAPPTIASRLLDLHIAERAILPVDTGVDQRVELVQVSADTRSLLAPELAKASTKLTGMQLHHFGAFYKSSWRANDWMWGRLDGAGWLVHLLLAPSRVLALAEAGGIQPPERPRWFLDRMSAAVELDWRSLPTTLKDPDRAAIPLAQDGLLAELEYLTDTTVPVPSSLPLVAIWAASSLQTWVATNELPVVAREMLVNPGRSVSSWPQQVLTAADRTTAAVEATRVALATSADAKARKAAADLMLAAARAAVHDAGERAVLTTAEQVVTAQIGASTVAVPPGAAPPPATAPVDDPARAAALARLLPSCPVSGETIGGEVGSPLFTRTVTKATAVATAALTGGDHPPAALSPVLSGARAITLTGYRATGLTGARPRRMLLVGLAMIVVGILAAIQQFALLGLTGVIVALVGAYVCVFAVWGLGARAVRAAVATTVLGLLVALWLPFVRNAVFGSAGCPAGDTTCQGYVSTSLAPWLRDQRWPWLVPILVLVGAGLLGAVLGWSSGRRRPGAASAARGARPAPTPRRS